MSGAASVIDVNGWTWAPKPGIAEAEAATITSRSCQLIPLGVQVPIRGKQLVASGRISVAADTLFE